MSLGKLKMLDKICGIYCIENILNGKKYVGRAKDIKQRWRGHRSDLNKKIHQNHYLQNSWNKNGEENFKFYILERCTNEECKEREIYYINKLESIYLKNGYNLTTGGDGLSGATEETRRKLSILNKGRKHTDEAKEKISKAGKGRIVSEETRKKKSISMMGKLHSIESILKMSVSKIGHAVTDETREKISKSNKNKPRNFSEEYMIRLKENFTGENNPNYGKPMKKETKDKMIATKLKNKKPIPVKKTKKELKSVKDFTSNFLGVSYRKDKNKWRAYLNKSNRGGQINLGMFKTEEDAARAYDKYVINNSIDRELNFPERRN